MGKKDQRDEFERLVSSGDPEDALKALSIYDGLVRQLARRYGLVFEEGSDKEDGYGAEGVAKDLDGHIPVPLYRPDLSMAPHTGEGIPHQPEGNLLLEGDNLHWLTVLQQTHKGKVDVIYIDPPYGTGTDGFSYNDKFVKEDDDWRHSKWLSVMSARLKLAWSLIDEEGGAIFISMGYDHIAQLKLLCDAEFGEKSFVSFFIWNQRTAKSDVPHGVSKDNEFVVCYAKPGFDMTTYRPPEQGKRKYYETPDYPGRPWRWHDMTKQTSAQERPNSFFTMVNPKNGAEYPCREDRTWCVTIDTFPEYYEQGRIIFPGDYDFLKIKNPVMRYWKEDDDEKTLQKSGGRLGEAVAVSSMLPKECGRTGDGKGALAAAIGPSSFKFPKPPQLIAYLVEKSTVNKKDAVILDFFAGSGSTAQAVAALNARDGGQRKWILCTNNELDSSAENSAISSGLGFPVAPKKTIDRKKNPAYEEWVSQRAELLESDEYKDFLQSDAYAAYGICRAVTKPRIDAVITGIRPDGERWAEPLGGSYDYYTIEMVSRCRSLEDNFDDAATPETITHLASIAHGIPMCRLEEVAGCPVLAGEGALVAVVPSVPRRAAVEELAAAAAGAGAALTVYIDGAYLKASAGMLCSVLGADADIRKFESLVFGDYIKAAS